MPNPPTHCLECNAVLSTLETTGLCARCLLKLGFASQFGQPSIGAAGSLLSVPPPLLPFDFGGYRVLRLLGRGGMGAVYEAEHLDSGRRVALKVLGHSIDSEEARKRFLREGRLAAAVSHPNSVYVYGTEEIEGAPVIAMELATGGTLRDLVKKRGPLPSREAVDIILQVISGLSTAQEAGVLHRDVKPANCFVTPDGVVKVGDFGLSVSTLARADSQLTASGVMLGTPSYAPPEQLRGDELDVRADIYSVGATLYALLTGRAPFEGDNAVQVVAAVLDKQPSAISSFRADVPPALAQVIMQCMDKRREARPANYQELREALIPFCSEAPEPAPLGLRFVAGVIDGLVVMFPYLIYVMYFGSDLSSDWLGARDTRTFTYLLIYIIGSFAYYGLTEGLWGAGLGKMLCGLRVVRPGYGAPGIMRATMRAIILGSIELSGYALQYFVTDAATFRERMETESWMLSDTMAFLFFVFFLTMRKRNGYAAIHDLATGTRVIVKPRSPSRNPVSVAKFTPPPPSAARIGPFLIDDQPPIKEWLTGYDELLRRQVWIKRTAPNIPQVSETRRALSRAGRTRWLAGVRADAGGWDAYEAPMGCRLTQIEPRSQSWGSVRHWLADLTQEIEAAKNDGTLPKGITLDHVWLTRDGRAVLLDESMTAPSTERAIEYNVDDIDELQNFLDAVATHATDRRLLPLHALDFLERVSRCAFDRGTFVQGNLQSLMAKPAQMTRRRRIASLMLAPSICLLASAALAIGVYRVWQQGELVFRKENPGQSQMLDAIRVYAQASGSPLDSMEWVELNPAENAKFAEVVGKWIVYRYGEFIRSGDFDAATRTLTKDERELAKKIVKNYPDVRAEEYDGFNAMVTAAMDDMDEYTHRAIIKTGPAAFVVLLVFVAVVNLASVLFFGTSLGLRLFGLCVVDQTGRPASRVRHLVRNSLAYSAGFGVVAFLIFSLFFKDSIVVAILATGLVVAGLALSCAFFVSVLIWPDRSWYDRIVGTHVVLR